MGHLVLKLRVPASQDELATLCVHLLCAGHREKVQREVKYDPFL